MHKNSQKRIYGDYIYIITCNAENETYFFTESIFCELWIKHLILCKELHQYKLYAFCLNYDHFHLMIKPNNEIANYSDIIKFLKRNFSQNVNKIMGYNEINEGDNAHCRIRREHERKKMANRNG